jgi:hypothetical protein
MTLQFDVSCLISPLSLLSSVTPSDSSIAIGDFLKDLLVSGGKYYGTKSWHIYAPGAKFDYSNIGATTAAHVCECLAKKLAPEARADLINSVHGLLGNSNGPYGVEDNIMGANATDFDSLARAMFSSEWSISEVGYHVADLKGLDIAIPSKEDRGGTSTEPKFIDYCLYGYPDYPDGAWRTTPTSYSALFRTFINFGTAPTSLGGEQVR